MSKKYYLDVTAFTKARIGICVEADSDLDALAKIRSGAYRIIAEDTGETKIDEDTIEYRYDEDAGDGDIRFRPEKKNTFDFDVFGYGQITVHGKVEAGSKEDAYKKIMADNYQIVGSFVDKSAFDFDPATVTFTKET